MLAVTMASMAARHGLTLSLSGVSVEGMTIGSLVKAGRAWRSERWARQERQERRAKSARQIREIREGVRPGGTSGGDVGIGGGGDVSSSGSCGSSGSSGSSGSGLVGGAHLSKGGQRAVQLAILERDGRDPLLPLQPVGGLGACAVGDLERACALAASGWLAMHATDKHGSTALMWAAGGGHLTVARWLLEEVGVAVDAVNKDRRTALQWACKTGRCEVAAYLLNTAHADPTLRMKDDSTAFDWAVLSGAPDRAVLSDCHLIAI